MSFFTSPSACIQTVCTLANVAKMSSLAFVDTVWRNVKTSFFTFTFEGFEKIVHNEQNLEFV